LPVRGAVARASTADHRVVAEATERSVLEHVTFAVADLPQAVGVRIVTGPDREAIVKSRRARLPGARRAPRVTAPGTRGRRSSQSPIGGGRDAGAARGGVADAPVPGHLLRRRTERSAFPRLSQAQITAALMYDARYRDEVQAQIDANAALTPAAIEKQYPGLVRSAR
jgi:hypothetical protein